MGSKKTVSKIEIFILQLPQVECIFKVKIRELS